MSAVGSAVQVPIMNVDSLDIITDNGAVYRQK
jgi:hypothetical protein